ncbi:MAG TPA: peptidoglycan DD-metalloendopeptidase family protein [Candidatus Limnocylindria bacterium]|jgi:murein DD-endopeptidase MepM/ murein hydrolase activator NlpD|nr:peptidoglycan DD-metalloendopeptidase family protein [Candidatus Limnocylindria bacterium]
MSIVRRRAVLAVGLVALVLALAPGGVRHSALAGGSVDDAIAEQQRMEAELARQRQQLADLRRQQSDLTASLAQLSTDLSKAGLELAAAKRQLSEVTDRLQQSRRDLDSYREQIRDLQSNLEAVAAELVTTRHELSTREALLQDHIRVAYEQSQTSLLEVILSTESFGEASNQLTSMLTLSDEDRRLADEIRETRERLAVRQQTLTDGRETLTALRDAEKERSRSLAQQQRQVEAARAQLKAYERQLSELRARQAAQYAKSVRTERRTRAVMDAERGELANQKDLVDRLKARANRLDLAYRGRFAWPEKGAFLVTQEFGWTNFDHHHTGIDMAYRSGCGGPIYAAGDGVVLADGHPNMPYDTAMGVIIGHSQRLQSWYWHLSREIVSVGEKIHTGDVIGYEGATGIATGCHLHFQVMLDDTPVNPRNYLP